MPVAHKEQVVFVLGLMFVSFVYGYLVAGKQIFPYSLFQQAKEGYTSVAETLGLKRRNFYYPTERTKRVEVLQQDLIAPGLTLVSGFGADSQIEARVIDAAGTTIHRWTFNWFGMWPDATHIDPRYKPRSKPGTYIHGIVILDNGDLVFNLDRTGLFRVDGCGKIVWRVPRMTHHSVFRDDEGNFWVPSLDMVHESRKELPSYRPSFHDYSILKISDAGKIIGEWSVNDILVKNGLRSLLYMTPNGGDYDIAPTEDMLHFNDLEVFPRSLQAGVFAPGDVMLSLRNIHTVLVFNNDFSSVKHMFVGPFIRQHDPDFLDGNTITVFDNNMPSGASSQPSSRLLRLSALKPGAEVLFEGSAKQPFFTNVMGKQQRLSNGNYLLTETTAGRAIEVAPDRKIVWDYANIVADHTLGRIDEAQRLGPQFTKSFFDNMRCPAQAGAT